MTRKRENGRAWRIGGIPQVYPKATDLAAGDVPLGVRSLGDTSRLPRNALIFM
jgi:hypothetical protein